MHAPFFLALPMPFAPISLSPDRDRAHATQGTRAMAQHATLELQLLQLLEELLVLQYLSSL
jgi:hypothetical protein